MLSFNFEEPFGQPYRAYLFVNGWMMGKRVGNLGYAAYLCQWGWEIDLACVQATSEVPSS